MIFSAPSIAQGGPARVLVLKDWYKILLQYTGAGTVFLGTSKDEAGRIEYGNTQDGIQLNAGNATVPFDLWWKGELWASGSDPNTNFVVIIPGFVATDAELSCISAEEQSFV